MRKYKNIRRVFLSLVISVVSGVFFVGCSDSDTKNSTQETNKMEERGKVIESDDSEESLISTAAEFDIDTSINEDYTDESYDKNAQKVELSETYTITSSGTYILSGDIKDGQIVVNNTDTEKVKLVFDGVNINCSNGPAVNVIEGKTIITLAEGSENNLTDGSAYDDTELSACVYSKDDLCINGSGTLNVSANYKTGIQSKDDLRIINGNITVNATGDGIKGKDSVVIKGGNINVTAGKDGIQSTNVEEGRGYVLILGGDILVSSASDGIKGENVVEINDGNVKIEKSEEGIEGIYIRINGGDISVCASDDGINASDGSGMDAGGKFGGGNRGGFWGNNTQTQNSSDVSSVVPVLYVNGGNLYVDAGGDGLDSNGAVYINGGNIKVDGPTNSGNGFFDYATAFEVKGGELIGCGSAGMMEVPDANSAQNSIIVTGINGAAGDTFTIKDSKGNQVVTYEPSKTFQAVAYSSEALKTGETYTAYNNDTEIGNVTISQSVSYIGETGAGMHGGGFGGKDFDRGNRNPQDMPEMPTGENQTPPEMPTGENQTPPEMPTGEGQMPPEGFFGGERPQMPMENETDGSV